MRNSNNKDGEAISDAKLQSDLARAVQKAALVLERRALRTGEQTECGDEAGERVDAVSVMVN